MLCLLAIVACVRTSEGTSPVPDGSTASASTATPSAPPASGPAQDFSISLVARPAPDGTSADVHALVPDLSIDEPLGNIQGAAACTSWWRTGVWSVSCTPGFRTIRLSLRPGRGELVVDRTGVASRSVPTPVGSTFSGDQQVVGVHDASDAACAGDAGVADVQMNTQAELTDARGIGINLVAAGTSIFLGEMKSAVECVAKGDGNERTIACEGRPACTLRLSGARVDFVCDLPAHGVGSLFLPCGAKVRLPSGTLPRTVHYH